MQIDTTFFCYPKYGFYDWITFESIVVNDFQMKCSNLINSLDHLHLQIHRKIKIALTELMLIEIVFYFFSNAI